MHMNRERRVSESTEIATRDGGSSPGSLISTVSSELNGIAAQTSSMFSGFFSKFILIIFSCFLLNFIYAFN